MIITMFSMKKGTYNLSTLFLCNEYNLQLYF